MTRTNSHHSLVKPALPLWLTALFVLLACLPARVNADAAVQANPMYFLTPECVANPVGDCYRLGLYNYAPSVMRDGGTTKVWWCGQSPSVAPGGDAVFYSEKVDGGTWSTPQRVFTHAASGWDSVHACDPSVVKGQFWFAGQNYAYAMYYTGSITGLDGQVGVAFSNDGKSWLRRGAPVVSPAVASSGSYGAGMQTAHVEPGTTAGVILAYTDSTRGNTTCVVSSRDGISFGAPDDAHIRSQFRDEQIDQTTIGDIAFSPSEGYWYIAMKAANDTAVKIYRSANASLLSGWLERSTGAVITSNLTGNARNHNPGFLRYPDGSIYRDSAGRRFVYYGSGIATDNGPWYITETALVDAWDFSQNGDREGWSAGNVQLDSGPSGGVWNVISPGSDPWWLSPNIGAQAKSNPLLQLKLATQNTNTNGKIYFRTTTENYFSEDKVVPFSVVNSGTWMMYPISLAAHPKYAGTITGLRVDPIEIGSGRPLGIDYVRLGQPMPDQWNFDVNGNREGWTSANLALDNGPAGGLWTFIAQSSDPFWEHTDLGLAASRYTKLEIRLANQNASSSGQVYFRTRDADYYSEDKSFLFTVNTSGSWNTYTINLTSNPQYRGTLTGIRIDPVQTGSGRPLGVDYIRLLP